MTVEPVSSRVISVKPAADFGNGEGMLIVVTDPARPHQVTVQQADRVIYVLKSWVEQVRAGQVPWAEFRHDQPWIMGASLKIRGEDGNVVYMIAGACGPRVDAYLCEQPD